MPIWTCLKSTKVITSLNTPTLFTLWLRLGTAASDTRTKSTLIKRWPGSPSKLRKSWCNLYPQPKRKKTIRFCGQSCRTLWSPRGSSPGKRPRASWRVRASWLTLSHMIPRRLFLLTLMCLTAETNCNWCIYPIFLTIDSSRPNQSPPKPNNRNPSPYFSRIHSSFQTTLWLKTRANTATKTQSWPTTASLERFKTQLTSATQATET